MAEGQQAGEGYKCSCGFISDDISKFRKHILDGGRLDKGNHKSEGRVNLLTGEITMPPYAERSREEKAASVRASKAKSSDKNASVSSFKNTDVLSQATELKFVPRVFTCGFTGILQSAMIASQREWGWRQDMPLENFLDTVVYNYFHEHGITLGGYVVHETNNNGNGTSHEEVEPEPEPIEV